MQHENSKLHIAESIVSVEKVYVLYKPRSHHYNARSFWGAGGIAQLVERLHGMQEVSGSTPLISTN